MIKHRFPAICFAFVSALVTLVRGADLHPEATTPKARLLVLTDIEADPDDTQSLVRLMLYSNVIDIEGLVATTSVYQKTSIAPESIRAVIDAYAKVRNNLLLHEPDFPEATTLQDLVKRGLPVYGMQGVGTGKDSEGSEWIIQALSRNDERPLWVSVWGGANTLAQALHKIRATKDEKETRRLLSKLRVYTISDQDDSGIWIRKNFPELFYIVSPGGYAAATWGGIMQVVPGIDNSTLSNRWLATHIQQGHGPLGAMYPDVAYSMEGDTPAFLGLIPNGLNSPEHPDWGGWGGRYELYRPEPSSTDPKGFNGGVPVEPEPRAIWTNAYDEHAPALPGEHGRSVQAGKLMQRDFRVTIWRWRDEFQNDFAARMDWSTKSRDQANHPPRPVLAHDNVITVKGGQMFHLDARGSTDPDGDSLTYHWFHYPEPGSLRGPVTIDGAENRPRIQVLAPMVDKPATAHFVLKLTDKGSPSLTRYQRVIVTVIP